MLIPQKISCESIKVVHEFHDHCGVFKTLKFFRDHFYLRGINKDTKRVTQYCDPYQRVKYFNYTMKGKFRNITVNNPGETVSVDFYGPLPKSRYRAEYIFVLIDIFSKVVTLHPIQGATTKTCLKILLIDYIPKMEKPKAMLSDNGTQFTSPKWKMALIQDDIRVKYFSARDPKSNPVERQMRELGRLFRIFFNENHADWASHLSRITKCLSLRMY